MPLIDWLLSKSSRKRKFHGGLSIPTHKAMSTSQAASVFPIVDTYYLSLRQKDNQWLIPEVALGEEVLAGQIIASPSSNGGTYLHAPTSGRITAIEPHVDAQPDNTLALSIILSADGKDNKNPPLPILSLETERELLLERIIQSGIAGMGGAGFPTARKLSNKANTLIINAAECEPYITCDDMQIREQAKAIIQGAKIAAKIINAERIIFGIEDDKPQAITALKKAITEEKDCRISLKSIAPRYPSGNSRQLFELLLGIRVPSNKHASDYGLICHNTATMKAIFDAVFKGEPLIERYITLTGEGCQLPQVTIARIGTPLDKLMQKAKMKANSQLIIGGPMMGFPLQSFDAGVEKTTNCLLMLPPADHEPEMDCIRCARCSDACPMKLMPQQLFWYSRDHNEKRLNEYRLFDCIECGICASVCPSHIPLVNYYRDSKKVLRQKRQEVEQSEKARERFEARETRLQREAEERVAKMAAKRIALEEKAKMVQSAVDQEFTAAPAPKAPQQSIKGRFNPTTETSAVSKQEAISAAKARANARRQERLQKNDTENPTQSDMMNSQAPTSESAIQASDKLAAAKAKSAERRNARLAKDNNHE